MYICIYIHNKYLGLLLHDVLVLLDVAEVHEAHLLLFTL